MTHLRARAILAAAALAACKAGAPGPPAGAVPASTPSTNAVPARTSPAWVAPVLPAEDASVATPVPGGAAGGAVAACAGPSRVVKIGDLPGVETSWASGDVLSDWSTHRSWYAPTLAPTAYAAPGEPSLRDPRWRIEPGPDDMTIDIVDVKSGKAIAGKAPFSSVSGDLAVDTEGRVFDLAAKRYADERRFRCHPTEGALFHVSATRRFVVCDAHGRGITVRDRAAEWEAPLGDGSLRLSPDDTFGLIVPGPFTGSGGTSAYKLE